MMFDRLEKEIIRLFSWYVVFAGVATVVDFTLLYLLTQYLNIWYFYSAACSYVAGMITNYTLNKYFNFRNKSKKIILQFGLFSFVAIIGLIMNQIIIYFLVEFIGLWYMMAKVFSVSIVMFWSFYGHKKLTFGVLE